MKVTANTPIIQALIRIGFDRSNAWRIVNENTSASGRALIDMIKNLRDRGIAIKGTDGKYFRVPMKGD